MPTSETIRYTCPHCDSKVKGPATAAGKTATCPGCQKPFTLTAPSTELPPAPVAPRVLPARAGQTSEPSPPAPVFLPADRDPERPVVRRPVRGFEDDDADAPPRRLAVEHRARGSFGTGLKLTLGILTAVGLVVTGLVLVFCILPMTGLAVVGGRAANAVAEAAEKRRQDDAKAMTVADPKTGKEVIPPTVATPSEPARAGLNQSAIIGDVEVRIWSVTAGHVLLKGLSGEGESESKLLRVAVIVGCRSDTKKVNYQSWHGNVFLNETKCQDNFGNFYKWVNFGFGNEPVGRTRTASAVTGKPVNDVLLFELPIPKAEYVDIDLDGDKVGERSAFRFRIPSSAWAGKN